MKNTLILLLTLSLFAIGCDDDEGTNPGDNQVTDGWEVGDRALDFELEDADGSMASLTDYRGKLVLMEFWDLDCSICMAEMPDVERLWDDYRDRNDFVIIGLSQNLDETRWKNYVTATGNSGFPRDWVQVFDSHLQPNVFSRYRVTKTPMRLLLDENGVILHREFDGVEMRTLVEAELDIQ